MTDLDSILDECLEKIERGEASLEDCVVQHPEHAEALRPLIREALQLRFESSLVPDPRARSRIRARLAQHMRRHPRQRESWLAGLLPGPALRWAAASVLAVIMAVGSVTWVAQAATPGTQLYPIKRASEMVWGRIVGQDRDYQVWLAERRLTEWMAVQNVEAESDAAREAYRRSLSELQAEVEQGLPAPVAEELREQRRRLESAGLREPKLDELLAGSSGATPVPSLEPADATSAPGTPIPPDLPATATEDSILDDLLPTPEDTEILP